MDPECAPHDEEVGFELGDGRWLLFQRVPEPKTAKNRLHRCREPNGRREAEVDRLLALGASLLADRCNAHGTGWAVLAEPERNELCVLRSAGDRAATT